MEGGLRSWARCFGCWGPALRRIPKRGVSNIRTPTESTQDDLALGSISSANRRQETSSESG